MKYEAIAGHYIKKDGAPFRLNDGHIVTLLDLLDQQREYQKKAITTAKESQAESKNPEWSNRLIASLESRMVELDTLYNLFGEE